MTAREPAIASAPTSSRGTGIGAPILVETRAALAEVAARAARAERIAVDVESNGLFAYRPALCVLQLAWSERGAMAVAVVDTMATPIRPLASLFGAAGPVKVLHDLTFDARLLAEHGAPLGRVRDTSVAARLLGRRATGLSTLLASDLGVFIDKRLQQHDWARRPLRPVEIEYLAGDVRHLLDLDEALGRDAEAAEITAEVAEECAYKLITALGPRKDPRPAWTRVKGAAALDAASRSALRRLVDAREEAAAQEDVPPFKIASNDALLDLARARPGSPAEMAAARLGGAGLMARYAGAWLAAVASAARDGDAPAEDLGYLAPAPPSRAELGRRRAREVQVSQWRRAEAAQRGVDEQAVLPGHCAEDLVAALIAHDAQPDATALGEAIARIPGLGACRVERYGEAFAALAANPPFDDRGSGSASGPAPRAPA
jgi:ribonuclease D